MNNFEQIKKEYIQNRENERKKIIDYLAKQKDAEGNPLFKKENGKTYEDNHYRYSGGTGSSVYGKTRFENSYDLSNWKYIVTKYNDTKILISLQSFDIDPNSGNVHILTDRIGLYFYDNVSEEKIEVKIGDRTQKIADPFLKMQVTEFELPLSEQNLAGLVELIKEKVE